MLFYPIKAHTASANDTAQDQDHVRKVFGQVPFDWLPALIGLAGETLDVPSVFPP